jgi:hypothetical protein
MKAKKFKKEERFNLPEFRSACRTGGFQSVILEGMSGCFALHARSREGGLVTLVTTRSRSGRIFKNPEDALRLLHRMGATRVEVAIDAWQPVKRPIRRPDSSERLKKMHGAAKRQAEAEARALLAKAEEERRAAAGMVLSLLKRGLAEGLFRDEDREASRCDGAEEIGVGLS